MKKILIKSNKLHNSSPSGGQFYSAFSTIEALFNQFEKLDIKNRLILAFYFPYSNETNIKKYLQCNYKRVGDYVYPISSKQNDGKWDLIHLLTEDLNKWDMLLKKTIFHIRGIQDWVLHPELEVKTKYKRHLFVKYLGRMASLTLVPSTDIKNELVKHYKYRAKKITVIPNGFDESKFKVIDAVDAFNQLPNSGYDLKKKKIILHVSDLSYKKNIETLLNAFKLINEKTDAHLVIIGGRTDEYISKYEKYASKLGLSNSVSFLGKVDQTSLLYYYNIANHFIFPSRSESFGKPALEAMACGCPAIVSKRTAAIDFMKDSDLLVNPHDTKMIADLSIKLLTSDEYNKSQKVKALEYASSYTWNHTAEKLINLYLKMA